ncbi:MAG: YigZ family protein [Desulfitobacteriaceae bacterium]|nr:YigZ family protein [Desulfitobacteriaceae bacterium]MDD4346231.1 YigZ family protein [Desulfitobacteriaceae bacterium]MDD4401636.1 YigZ family protein [Desulfitobacteriaceae bacterium]
MDNNSFYVINQTASWEQTVEKSRFIAIVHHVTNVDEVAASLQAIRVEYPNARHYVYAYRLKVRLLEKSTDDGEPQGTGGKQVLEQLQHRQLWDVLVVVVRYFGGILLGTGGLSRAYSGTVRGLLERLCPERVRQHILYDLCIPYSYYEALKYQFSKYSWTLQNERFSEFIDVNAYVPQDEGKEFEEWLKEFASGLIKFKKLGIIWR